MSIVRIGLAARAPGLSRLAAQQYWRNEHARIFARVPELMSYVQNHAVLDDSGEPLFGEPGFDIFAEVEFEDEPTIERAANSQYYRDVILADEKNLLDASRRTFLMTRRRVLAGTPDPSSTKVALFLARTPRHAILSDEAMGLWLNEASQCAPQASATVAYMVDYAGGTVPLPIDVVLQHYFATLDAARHWYGEARTRWIDERRDWLRIVTGVVAVEFEVVPRSVTRRAAEARL